MVTRDELIHDVMASIVVFLVAVPLSMGVAIASGVPMEKAAAVGLLTGIIGGTVVGLFSGCPLQVSGAAAGLAVMVSQFIEQFGWEKLPIIVFLAGMVQVLAGVFRLGSWFRAFPPAVIEGMLAGIGVLIFASQIHIMVDDTPPGIGKTFGGAINLAAIPSALIKTVSFPEHRTAGCIGLTTILTTFLWSRWAPKRVRIIPSPLVAVIIATTVAAFLRARVHYVPMPDNILDAVGAVSWNIDWSSLGGPLALASLALAFVASAESLLTATAADTMQQHAPRTDYDRELVAQGIGNSICGILHLLPLTGVVMRTVTNIQSGARTRAATIFHGFGILIFSGLFSQILRWVPIASLAAILVHTGIRLFKWRNLPTFWRISKGEFLTYFTTLSAVVLVDLLTGIITGMGVAIFRLLFVFSHFEVALSLDLSNRRANMHLAGAATFIRLPKLADALKGIPGGIELHVNIDELTYIDHACWVLLNNWRKQHEKTGGLLMLDWEILFAKSRGGHRNISYREIIQKKTES